MTARRTLPALSLLLAAGLGLLAASETQAGPLLRRAQQIYAMGNQKLSGMFGPNPCPQIKAP